MALFCRKRSYPDSPPPVEVTVKRCASCPVACTPHVNLHRCLDDRGLLPRLFRHKKSRKQVTGGKWKSYDDVTLQSMTSQHLEGQDPSEGEFGKSKVFNNPIYQPPVCTTPPHDSSTGPQETEDPKIHIEEASPDTTSQNPSLQMKTPQEPSLITSPPEQSLIGRLMKESRRWKRKESKFVHTQPLYQDYCVYYTKGAPGLSPSVFSVDTSLSFAGLISSSLLGSQVINASPPLYTSSLWQELPEVKVKGIVQTMSPQKRQLQEAIFEVVASEASYLRSLSVAIGHFQKSRRIQECLGTSDRHTLFSNLPSVREVSERFLLDLEEGLEKDLYLSDIGERVLRHCPEFKRVYIPYVTNQMYQEKLMQQLIRENARFLQVLQKLEEQPVCKRQLLKSFLVLPFQRITRLKILLENILKLAQGDVELSSSLHNAASAVGEIVSRCNEGVRCMMQTEELVLLEKRMDFHHTKSLPLISRGRALVQHGELVRIFFQELGIGHKPRLASKPIYIHLFSDLLLLSSRTDAGRFQVTDYARRGQVKADNVKAKALGLPTLVFLLRLTQNHSGLSCEIVLQATNEHLEHFGKRINSDQSDRWPSHQYQLHLLSVHSKLNSPRITRFEKEHWISQITRQMSQESSC